MTTSFTAHLRDELRAQAADADRATLLATVGRLLDWCDELDQQEGLARAMGIPIADTVRRILAEALTPPLPH